MVFRGSAAVRGERRNTRKRRVRVAVGVEQNVPELSAPLAIIHGDHVKNAEECLLVLSKTSRVVVDARRGEHLAQRNPHIQ